MFYSCFNYILYDFAHLGVPTDIKGSLTNQIMIFNFHVLDMMHLWKYRLIQKIVWVT